MLLPENEYTAAAAAHQNKKKNKNKKGNEEEEEVGCMRACVSCVALAQQKEKNRFYIGPCYQQKSVRIKEGRKEE